MSAREYVDALYRLCLGRPADATGLDAWTPALEPGGDPTAVLAGLLASEEYRQRSGAADRGQCAEIAATALAALGRRPRVVDVGAQSLGDGSHAYSPLFAMTPLDIVGFDPLAARLAERAEREINGGTLTLLPYAIADGRKHTLYVNNDDATSSLLPLDHASNARFNHLSTLETVRTEEVQTHRLDDVLPPGPVDFLKLDVQGAELMVLRGGPETVARAAVVHCEVEFSPIYAGQPLFAEIQSELGRHGFALVDLLNPARYHYLSRSGVATNDRLLWADAVFFRDTDDSETLCAQALIAAGAYDKPTLAEHLLARLSGATD